MAAPVLASVAPTEGLALGETFVTITGTGFNLDAVGAVRVFFDGVAATEVQVKDSTTVFCLTPRATLLPVAAVDVRVENVTPADPPNVVESDTLVAAFTYKRTDISTPADLSNHPEILMITRTLVQELKTKVLENTHHDVHPEYADAVDAAVPEEHQAVAPSLKVLGPDVAEDPFYRHNADVSLETSPDTFRILKAPVTVQLTFQYVGVGRTPGEAQNLWLAVTRFVRLTTFLRVIFPSSEVVDYELNPIWEERARFASQATRQAVYQFTGSLVIRGVHVASSEKAPGQGVTVDVVPEINPL